MNSNLSSCGVCVKLKFTVVAPDGTYILTYAQWARERRRYTVGIATSKALEDYLRNRIRKGTDVALPSIALAEFIGCSYLVQVAPGVIVLRRAYILNADSVAAIRYMEHRNFDEKIAFVLHSTE